MDASAENKNRYMAMGLTILFHVLCFYYSFIWYLLLLFRPLKLSLCQKLK